MSSKKIPALKDGDQCSVTGGTHKGKQGIVQDINTSKTGHVTITVLQENGVRFKTLARNVTVANINGAQVKREKAKATPLATENFKLYQKLVSSNKNVELKGKTLPYTSCNGNMFSALYQDGTVGIRLSETDREAFLKKYKSGQPEQHGAILKEYVIVPLSLLKKTAELKKYFEKSLAYAKSLKPKN